MNAYTSAFGVRVTLFATAKSVIGSFISGTSPQHTHRVEVVERAVELRGAEIAILHSLDDRSSSECAR